MKRRTRKDLSSRNLARTLAAYPAAVAGKGAAGSTSRLDIFTRATITGLFFLKRGLKAFWPEKREREKVTPRCDHDLKRILMPRGNTSRFLSPSLTSSCARCSFARLKRRLISNQKAAHCNNKFRRATKIDRALSLSLSRHRSFAVHCLVEFFEDSIIGSQSNRISSGNLDAPYNCNYTSHG